MLLNARRFESQDSGPELILLAFEEITERKRAEAALRDSEQCYRRLFEAAQDGILILDAKTGKVIDANPYIAGLLGYSRDHFLGKELWELGLFQDIDASRTAYQELQRNGYVRYEHLPLETKSGQRADVEFVSNIYHVDGKNVIQCNIRDITERRQLELAQLKSEALADLNRRKDEFLAMLAHELRNPLAPIMNAVHLLSIQKSENPILQQATSIIGRQATHLAHLVDDLLEVSRMTSGRIRLYRERLDARSVVERAVEAVRPLIDQHRHGLSISLPPQPIWIFADSTRVEQVIANLLNNAAKYTDEGGHIWLSVLEEGEEAVLHVRDTGVGIDPEMLPLMFELFTQAERTLDRSQGGLGIGLYLAQRLVEMHGGTIEAHSAGLGQGSEFTVRLSVALEAAPQSASSKMELLKATRPLRVLVVDDNIDAAESMAILLNAAGHESRVAHSGETALETAFEYQPNIVLLDIGLPGINGYEVAKQLRQHPQTKNVTLIAITGYGQDVDRQHSQKAGFDHHLVKPADFAKLEELLAALAGQEHPCG